MKPDCLKGSDEDLVKRSLSDLRLFGCIVTRYEKKLASYIRRITGISEEDIQDHLQEIFINVYKNLNDFDPDLKFSTWIFRIARNYTISEYRRRRIRPQVAASDPQISGLFDRLIDHEQADQKLINEERGRVMNELLVELDDKYRDVMVLRYLEEMDYQQISDVLEKPIGTVSTLLNRAHKRFRSLAEKRGLCLKEHCEEPSFVKKTTGVS